jgi:prepilin-type N-terminal cleavage/methylation domain-containing protein
MNFFSKLKIKNLRSNKEKGFTLIEVLVSVFIFAMVIIVISQIYIAILRTERVAYALLNSENNIRNNLEVIARSIRVGKNFTVSENQTEISFDYFSEGSWKTMEYRFNENENNLEKLADGRFFSLFDPQINVNYIRFYVQDSGPQSQRTIIIILEAFTEVNKQEYTFNVQTSITPRSLIME